MTKQPINTRSSFSLVIYLFYEGETELDYLQKYIQQQRKSSVRIIKKCQSPNPQYLVDQAIKNFSELKQVKNSEIWVVFDHDGREQEVQQAINKLTNSHKDIHLAFMKPCIEIWPLLHNNIDNVSSQHEAQSKLEKIMPLYNHDRNPRFDLAQMPNYEHAVKIAQNWDVSLDGAPPYQASKFAGIYKLTEKIKKAK